MSKLHKLLLAKDWNKHEAGSEVSVDRQRADWLVANGYVLSEREPKKSERVPKQKKRSRNTVASNGE